MKTKKQKLKPPAPALPTKPTPTGQHRYEPFPGIFIILDWDQMRTICQKARPHHSNRAFGFVRINKTQRMPKTKWQRAVDRSYKNLIRCTKQAADESAAKKSLSPPPSPNRPPGLRISTSESQTT